MNQKTIAAEIELLALAEQHGAELIRRVSALIMQISGAGAHIRYKLRKKRTPGTHLISDVADIRNSQKGRCAYCRAKLGNGQSTHVDHIVPISKGGDNGRRNLQILCRSCNNKKCDRDATDFARSLGLLI